MGIDGQLKRLFPLVLGALIVIAAYFQGSGISQLIASGVAADTAQAPAEDPLRTRSVRAPMKTGRAILARNPFDSVTGPLDGSAVPIVEDTVAEPSADPDSNDPACSFGRVALITASPQPAWSFAAIEDAKGESKLRRIGDEVSGHTIRTIYWDRVQFESGSKVCQLKLGEGGKKARKKKPKKSRRKKKRRGRELPAKLASKITKISDTEFLIERSVVAEIMGNQAELMRSARIVPEKKGGKVVGIGLRGIRSKSLLSHLGLKNGDRLESINGFELSNPQKALEAYGRLQTADNLRVQVHRRGKPVTIEFKIQ